MVLKSLEIQGFKSFPDKTKIQFGQGLTAVVGPNGSGKSNISDAVRWVMGEQSTKNLRGSKMEDVIFTGTKARRSQGFAEVSLVIDNSDKTLEIDSDEVVITRKYYRSGESEYMINRTNVRLKDINELFMDTGLGRDGYAMVGQGRIAEIVQSKSCLLYTSGNYPECTFMTWDTPTRDVCPKCGKTLLKKAGRNGKIYCSNESCDYETAEPGK